MKDAVKRKIERLAARIGKLANEEKMHLSIWCCGDMKNLGAMISGRLADGRGFSKFTHNNIWEIGQEDSDGN